MSLFISHLIAFFVGGVLVLIYFLIDDIKIRDIKPEDAEFIIKQAQLFKED